MSTFLRICGFLLLLASASAHAETVDEKEICKAFTEYEDSLSKKLSLPADSITDVISMRINCVTKTQSWQQVIKAYDKELAQGWRERKQRQHTQLHCNNDGLSSTLGWTVVTQLSDKDYNLMAEFKTTPEMCTSR